MENYVFIPILILILGSIFLQGLKKIPANPPHIGQVTWLGKKIQDEILEEGWRFLIFYPYLKGFILVKVERITFEIICDSVRTTDGAESKIVVGLTICPVRELLIQYINTGQEKKVLEIITKIIEEKIREWCMGLEEGPATWDELNMSKSEAVSVLIRKIAGRHSEYLTEITGIAQKVPTWIWLRYFSNPQPQIPLENEKDWMKDAWKKVTNVLEEIKANGGEVAIETLTKQVEKRREEIEKIRNGQGDLVIKDLGIEIQRLNIGNVDVLGEVGKKAENEAKEKQERAGEILELKHISDRILALMEPFPDGPGLTREQALEQVQLSLKQTNKTIDAKSIILDSSTAEILGKMINKIL